MARIHAFNILSTVNLNNIILKIDIYIGSYKLYRIFVNSSLEHLLIILHFFDKSDIVGTDNRHMNRWLNEQNLIRNVYKYRH